MASGGQGDRPTIFRVRRTTSLRAGNITLTRKSYARRYREWQALGDTAGVAGSGSVCTKCLQPGVGCGGVCVPRRGACSMGERGRRVKGWGWCPAGSRKGCVYAPGNCPSARRRYARSPAMRPRTPPERQEGSRKASPGRGARARAPCHGVVGSSGVVACGGGQWQAGSVAGRCGVG